MTAKAPATNMANRVGNWRLPLLLISSVWHFGSMAYADDWKISPSLLTSESYNDNVLLQAAGPGTSAYITEITPRLIMLSDGPSVKLNLDYAVQRLFYDGDVHAERTNQMLAATSSTTLISNLFYVDGSANINQQNSTPFGATTSNNLNLSDNRLDLHTYSISPYLRTSFEAAASMELRFIRDFVNTSLGGLTDSKSNTVNALLKSGPAFKTVDWNCLLTDQTIYYRDQSNIDMGSAIVNASYHLTPEFALTSSAGYERDNYLAINNQVPKGTTWSAGFSWTPSTRTNVAASFGHHFYGDTYMVTANERAFASIWSLGYNEGQTSSRSQFLVPVSSNTVDFLNTLWQSSIPNAAQRQQVVSAFIQNTGLPATLTTPVNTITDQVFLQKTLEASVAITGARNTVLLSIFNVQRNAQSVSLAGISTDNLSMLNDTKQTGANIVWNSALSGRSNLTFMDSYTRSVSDSTGLSYNNNIVTASLNHQLQQKLRLTLQYQRIKNDTNFITGNFIENLTSILLNFSL